jgi:hypothetical protein
VRDSETQRPESEPGEPLEYRSPKLDAPDAARVVGAFVGGVIIAFVGVLIVGLFWGDYLRINPSIPPEFQRSRPWAIRAPVVFFGSIAIGAGVGCIAVWRDRPRHYFWLGLLFGLSIACLLEGLCYAAN